MFISSPLGHRETDVTDILRILGLDGLIGLDAYAAFQAKVDQFLADGDIASYNIYSVFLDDVYAFALTHEMGV